MAYTSYFAKIRKFPKDIVPIGIAVFNPKGYKGLVYKKLAPTPQILNNWKLNKNEEEYIRCYKHQILDNLDANIVFEELVALSKTNNFALCCYEKSEDFCHRHIVADWFRSNGIVIEEYRCE